MKDKGLDKGLIREFNTSDRDKRGWSKNFFAFRKMFWEYLNKLEVPFYDSCCETASDNPAPVRYNSETGSLERFDGTTWVEVGSGFGASATGITAFATGGQGSATALTVGYNEVTTVATAGDSVKLPTATVSSVVIVKNEGAAAADVFPFLGDTINDGVVNTAIRIAPGSTIIFSAVNSTNWEASNQILAAGDGAVALPAITFSTQPNMGFYKVSSTQLGTSVSGALVGGFNASGLFTDIISEQTTTVGVTVDSVLLKDGGVSNSGLTMIAAFYPQVVQNDIVAGAGGAISVANYLTTVNTDAGGDAFTLANGTQIGQMKKILLVVDGGGDAVITPATALAGGTTITFNDATDFVILQWSGAAWVVLENSGTTIA